MSRRVVRLPMLSLLLLGCPHAPAPPVRGDPVLIDPIEVGGASVRWYDVGGHDVVSLREALTEASPKNEAGERVLGRTDWQAAWRWNGSGEPCHVGEVVVMASLEVWLPRWTPGVGTDPALVERWREFLSNLAAHELGHVVRVRGGVDQLDEILEAASCEDVEAVGAATVEALRELNREYDEETGHGRLQGARFWSAPEWGGAMESNWAE